MNIKKKKIKMELLLGGFIIILSTINPNARQPSIDIEPIRPRTIQMTQVDIQPIRPIIIQGTSV